MIQAFLAALSPRTWLAVGVSVLMAFAGVQTLRLSHARHDLVLARAALVDPVTHRPWSKVAASAQADLSTCRINAGKLKGALDGQNAALQAQRDRDARSLAESAKAAQDARAVAASARHEAERILSEHLTGATACERAEDARRKYLERLQ